MIRFILLLQLCFLALQSFSQQGQLGVSRIDLMPDVPMPLQIRDWDKVARDFDNFVSDINETGTYLPLSRLGTMGQFNYPDNIPLFMDSYVGSDNHLNHAEAINIMPAIVGASLVGIDKSNQNGINWVASSKDFFNLKNEQNVYLNGYSTTSGHDWWYDLMPNIYFYQLKALYPEAAPEYPNQFSDVANQWLNSIGQMGGATTPWSIPNMNYRAFNLATGMPLTTSVPEPESAGSISWLLYNAYAETGRRDYFEGAQLAMDFLAGFTSNPSYELQLPYGTLAAARMNAVEGTNYPLQKLLDWCFERGDLRGWGSIAGNWGGYDVSGLIGEANDGGDDYAFVMNGFQQAAALAPIPKYDKRYARAIAKWILNITNASRLFYWNALPQNQQDGYAWASVNDPSACIPYESLKENWLGQTPFATGDALRGGWAATNLSLYSGSSVGYLAAVVQTTPVPEILQIDLNKTDFYGDNSLAAYLYFNPTSELHSVDVPLPEGNFSVYDAITETVLSNQISGSFQLPIPAGEVRLIRLFAANLEPMVQAGRLYVGSQILDYHYGYDYSPRLRIKALAVDNRTIIAGSLFRAYCEPGNVEAGASLLFDWFLDDVPVELENVSEAQLTAPNKEKLVILKCRVTMDGQTAEDTLHLRLVERFPVPPVVDGIQSSQLFTPIGEQATFTALVEASEVDGLDFAWSSSAGILNQTTGSSVSWQAPTTPMVVVITAKVTNQDQLSTTVSANVLVKNTNIAAQAPLIWYPFDVDNLNAVSDRFHATAIGAIKADDARGFPTLAYRFSNGQDIVFTDNQQELNFGGPLSLSCWVKAEQFGSERFIISHGSWQERYKLSITPQGYLRWTVKTNAGIADLDGAAPMQLNQFYHVTVVYTGYSMELYLDGVLNAFQAFSGELQTATKPITISRMDNAETLYSLVGSVDEVKLWNAEIPVSQIEQLKTQWDETTQPLQQEVLLYPNPADGFVKIQLPGAVKAEEISLFTLDGRRATSHEVKSESSGVVIEFPPFYKGIFLVKMILDDGRALTRKLIIR